MSRFTPIDPTDEFHRVDKLPWVAWRDYVTHNQGYLRLTTLLRVPKGTRALWPVQAAALAYIHDLGGAFCPIPVGKGKALRHGEPVLTEDGLVPIEKLKRGDRVVGTDRVLCAVTGVFPQPLRGVYDVLFDKDIRVSCDLDHLWTFKIDEKTDTRPLWEWREDISRKTVTVKNILGEDVRVRDVRYAGLDYCTCISISSRDGLFATRGGILTHNTTVSFLAPRVGGVQKPALLIPASLREKTWRDFRELYSHWLGHYAFMTRAGFDEAVFNYEEVSREKGQQRLFDYKPDMIIADEAQALKNRNASCTKAVEHYMYENPTTQFVALTGTPTARSPMDFWHLMFWCLREHMPFPRVHSEAELWAEAIRETKDLNSTRPDARVFSGWLPPDYKPVGNAHTLFAALEEPLRKARIAFGNRFSNCRGVVTDDDANDIGSALRISRLDWDPGPVAREAIETLRETKTTPNGVELTMPTEVWALERQLASGFWYYWDPQPPDWWLQPRRTWGWYLREILFREGMFFDTYSHLRLFSPKQVASAILQNRLKDYKVQQAYHDWIKVKDDYSYTKIAQWIDSGVLNRAAKWLSSEGGIVWTEHKAFGDKLSEITGVGFCSDQGLDQKGVLIDDYKGRPVIASVRANHQGRNLQAWNQNLGVTFPPNGAVMEQLLGRTHRPGQLSDTVYFSWVNACEAQLNGFHQLLADARYIEQSTGQRQKLNFADKIDD